MLGNDRYYRRYVPEILSGYTVLTSGFLKSTIYDTLIEIQYRLESKLVEKRELTDESFTDNQQYRPVFSRVNNEMSEELTQRFERLQANYGDQQTEPIIEELLGKLEMVNSYNDTRVLIRVFGDILRLSDQIIDFLQTRHSGNASIVLRESSTLLLVDVVDDTNNTQTLEYPRLDNNRFINVASVLFQHIRHEERKPTIAEYIAIQVGFEMVGFRGYAESPIVPWGNSGFRAIQTQASITDPGLGHLTGTVNSMRYINGTNVHVEFLERGAETNREKVEPYRLPDLATMGKVKMAVGRDTSVSSYVGRPMFEDTFENSFIKSVHTTVGVCSAIFMNGLSECKVAIERMTVMQAIKYMQAVSANVVRDRNLQVLAAAFCVNYPLIDDRPAVMAKNNGQPVKVTDRMDIARLGIEIAKAGRFEKVTFDGTADWYPSDPIMEQLGYQNALELVHLAHEQGLLTYFSAGFRFKHLPDIVLSGTDGIGLGGAQILRFMDHENGNQGPFKQLNVEKILEINRKTASSTLGQGTILLCRLDRMYYELSLPQELQDLRSGLYKALYEKNEATVEILIKKAADVSKISIDLVHPLVAWGQRIVDHKDTCLAFNGMNKDTKNRFIEELELNIEHHDYEQLADVLHRLKEVAITRDIHLLVNN
ncbi:hypothetical protein [Furfurilactobacillus milii]|uniref:Uncharacterized protein n=1 Tax=Furfurilactobacillus milii TaxID=2888272 RepID=A0A6N9HZX2_9LACO|nr:hypothetical protein [Furfurilactobacillus milii]MYV16037.1 hypothetical protein [Furfurilactobacillus milii]